MWSLSLQALGRPSATPALLERLWDERLRPLSRRGAARAPPAPAVITWAALWHHWPARPAGGDRPPPDRGAPAERSRVPHPCWRRPRLRPPSRATSPAARRGPIRRYWRGPTWVNSAWMVWLGMRRLGYEEEAATFGSRPHRRRRPAKACASTTTRAPGAALGAKDFAWSACVERRLSRRRGARRGERTPVRDPRRRPRSPFRRLFVAVGDAAAV